MASREHDTEIISESDGRKTRALSDADLQDHIIQRSGGMLLLFAFRVNCVRLILSFKRTRRDPSLLLLVTFMPAINVYGVSSDVTL